MKLTFNPNDQIAQRIREATAGTLVSDFILQVTEYNRPKFNTLITARLASWSWDRQSFETEWLVEA